ncbi:MAG: hypothetical protein CMO63_02835 [Verrucomicrobiales bacterium]|nr:hypothetical protein [Verrucomicrobiales bacterium]
MRVVVLTIFVSLLFAVNVPAQFGDPFGGGQAGVAKAATKARLLLSHATAKPGSKITAGIELKMDKGWHTYWLNPGAAGLPTSVKWTLPEGITAGKIQWPVPEKFMSLGSTGYGYHNETVLLVPLTVAADAPLGQAEITGKVEWLECKEQCNPRDQEVSIKLVLGQAAKESASAQVLRQWQKKLPKPKEENSTAKAWWGGVAKDDERKLIIEFDPGEAKEDADFFSLPYEPFELSPESTISTTAEGRLQVEKTVLKFEGDWPSTIAGLLVFHLKDHDVTRAVEVSLPIAADANSPVPTAGTKTEGTTTTSATVGPTSEAPSQSLGLMLLYAFLGGIILNVMPCVLPVISLKILGFVNQSQESPTRVRLLGMLYGAGVLVSFLILAGFVIGVKSAGELASWGMQMSNPQFVVLLTILVTLVALNLFGLFEVTLGSVGVAAGSVTSREGAGGAFFNGVLATILATPCTAPFLAPALGFAFLQSSGVIVLMFIAVAVGLALPYVVLSWNPKWLRFLPKPGPWMEKFKIAMGFPMLGTAMWLFMLTYEYYGDRILWFGIFLTLLAMAVWIFGEFFQRGTRRKGLALALAGLMTLGGVVFGLEGQLQWRNPIDPDSRSAGVVQDFPGGIEWHTWSPEAVAAAREDGQPVLVDFTAKWCITCIANKKSSIDIESVRAVMTEKNVKAFRADYTRRPDYITHELNKWNRAGVPLVLVFSPDTGQQAQVLPEVLTPGIVLDALKKAAG